MMASLRGVLPFLQGSEGVVRDDSAGCRGREAVLVSSGDTSFVRNKQFAHVEVAAVVTTKV